jgi:hypothetical protein
VIGRSSKIECTTSDSVLEGFIIINLMNKKRQFDLEFKIPSLPVKLRQEPARQTTLTAQHGITVTKQTNVVP